MKWYRHTHTHTHTHKSHICFMLILAKSAKNQEMTFTVQVRQRLHRDNWLPNAGIVEQSINPENA